MTKYTNLKSSLVRHLKVSVICLLLVACTIPIKDTVIAEDDGMVLVAAGEFIMGSNNEENPSMWRDANALNPYGFNEPLYVNERPAHKRTLPAFQIDKYEVTNAQYRAFTIATKRKIPVIWSENAYGISNENLRSFSLAELRQVATNNFLLDMDVSNMTQQALLAELEKINLVRDTHPVTMVRWGDAYDYCYWAGKRLPTEAEWEKAARGPHGFEYPWGNTWDPKKVNVTSNDADTPYSPVGSYPEDKSPYGVYDMASNVGEWVRDWYQAYPGAPPSGANSTYGRLERVARGGMASSGHYDSISMLFRSARRMHWHPDTTAIDLGFRCARSVK